MIVGSAFLMLAMGITFGGPVIFNAYIAWAHPDLLALPLYATGIFCLLYGLSGLQWGWPALAMLFLIWPTPLQVTLPGVLDTLVNFTAAALRALVAFAPFGTHPDGPDSALFIIATPQGDGILGIGSACAGFEAISTVGLLSGAMLLVSEHKAAARWQRFAGKLAWFACGIALATIGNIVRIAVVFGAAHAFGITFAMAVVHPYVGMIALALDLILLLVLRPRFGLSFTMPGTPRPLPWADLRWGAGMSFGTMLILAVMVWSGEPLFVAMGNRVAGVIAVQGSGKILWIGLVFIIGFLFVLLIVSMPDEQPQHHSLGPTMGKHRLLSGVIATLVIGSTVLLACANTTVAAAIEGLPTPDGVTLLDYETTLPPVAGSAPVYDFSVPWMQEYFGQGASRLIYNYAPLRADEELFTIVDTAPTAQGLNSYSLENCYAWHYYDNLRQSSVAIGHGVTATALTWYDPKTNRAWISVSWMQPITKDGETRHQRIALTTSFSASRVMTAREPVLATMTSETSVEAAEILNNLWR